MTIAVRLEGIVKWFGHVPANDHIDFDLAKGEIHGLLGENGSGKTTLMNILYGIYRPDAGRIYLNGEPLVIDSPRTALAHGVGMVHQHFMLAPNLTVVENLMLGVPAGAAALLGEKKHERHFVELAQAYSFRIDPKAYIWQLSVGEQQRVEIVKALYLGARILILDEPTGALTPQETRELFGILRRLALEGRSVILITHKLEEIMAIADRVTVLRDGRRVGHAATAETTPSQLARMMVGRDVIYQLQRQPRSASELVLRVEDVRIRDDRGRVAVRDVSLSIREGEILGLAGVDGNGQRELAEALAGIRPAESGRVVVLGRDLVNARPRDIHAAGVFQIPADRHGTGLIMDFDVARNLVLESYHRPPFSRAGFYNGKQVMLHARSVMQRYDIRASTAEVPVRLLSGGNQQKVVLARELHERPRVLVAVQPTRGLDVGATEYVRRKLLELRASGAAILLISTELEEILALSDRMIVIHDGKIRGEFKGDAVDMEELGLLMAGVNRSRNQT